MSLQLPAPLDLYFGARDGADPSVMDRCFASDATVRDEGKSIEGVQAIRAWQTDTLARYRFKAEPLSVSAQDGKTIVRCCVTGDFPGSPVALDHIFEIDGGLITSLEIR